MKVLSNTVAVFMLAGCSLAPHHALRRGNELLQKRDYAAAELEFRKAISRNAKEGAALHGLGVACLEQKKLDCAYVAFREAMVVDPRNDAASSELANLLLPGYWVSPDRSKLVYDLLQKASSNLLASDPRSNIGHRVAGYLAVTDNQFDKAIKHFEASLAAKADDHEAAAMLAQALDRNGSSERARSVCQDHIARFPDAALVYDVLYRQLLAANNPKTAENVLRRKAASLTGDVSVQLQLARHLRTYGKVEQMEEVLQAVATDRKRFPEGRLAVGDFYREIGRGDEAFSQFEAGAAESPAKRVLFRRRQAGLLLSIRRLAHARDLVERALEENPGDPELRRTRAAIYLEDSDPASIASALQELKDLIRSHPADGLALFHLGRAYMRTGDYAQAIQDLRRAVKIDPALDEARLALASSAFHRREYAQVLEQADNLLSRSPQNMNALLYRVSALRAMGRYSESRDAIATLRRVSPGGSLPELELAYLYIVEGRPANAEPIFKRLFAPGAPNVRVALGYAEALTAQRKYDQAARVLEADLAKAPNRTYVLLGLGETQYRRGDLNRAYKAFQQAARIDGTLAAASAGMARIHLERNQAQEALNIVEAALKASPGTPDLLAIAAYTKGVLGHPDTVQAYRAWAHAAPADPRPLNDLAYFLAERRQNLEEAVSLVNQARKLAPEDPAVTDTLGFVYLQKGMPREAVGVLSRLAEVRQAPAIANYHYGLALTAVGDTDKARKQFEAALKKTDEPALRQSISDALRKAS